MTVWFREMGRGNHRVYTLSPIWLSLSAALSHAQLICRCACWFTFRWSFDRLEVFAFVLILHLLLGRKSVFNLFLRTLLKDCPYCGRREGTMVGAVLKALAVAVTLHCVGTHAEYVHAQAPTRYEFEHSLKKPFTKPEKGKIPFWTLVDSMCCKLLAGHEDSCAVNSSVWRCCRCCVE